jgi:hypothetical protein
MVLSDFGVSRFLSSVNSRFKCKSTMNRGRPALSNSLVATDFRLLLREVFYHYEASVSLYFSLFPPLIVIVSAFCGQVLLRIERRSCNPVQLPSSIAHQHTTERVDHSTLSSLSSLPSLRTSGGRHRRSPVDIYNRQQSTTAQLSSSRWSQEMRISAAAVGEQHQRVTDPAPGSRAHCVEFAYQHSCRGYATLANGTS